VRSKHELGDQKNTSCSAFAFAIDIRGRQLMKGGGTNGWQQQSSLDDRSAFNESVNSVAHSFAVKTWPEKVYLYLKHFPATGSPLRVGTCKAVHGLATGLVAQGIEVDVWCEGESDSRVVVPEGYGIQCFANDSSYMTLRIARSLRSLLPSLRPTRDLVVLNGMLHPSVYALSRKLKALHIPYVVAPHGPYHPALFKKNPHLKWPYWYLLERRLINGALALQQLDVRHEVWARRLGITVPVVSVENGFEDKDVVPAESLCWRTEGPVRALFWGRMAMYTKGIDVLLAGFQQAAREHSMHLTLQGPDWSGEATAIQRLIASMTVADRIKTLPPEFEIPAAHVMVAHDIFCMPSRFEGFGLSALEAMLAGRVLMVSGTAGISPHVERSGCGVIVQPTAEDVHRGFRYLLSNRDRWREMGLRGREYALEHLHWNTIAQRTLNQYQQLVS
jgi:glycosyltransferase involved in cell wall biosynthesis